MLVMRILWLTPKLFGPKSSDVMETAAANMKPELRPMTAVLAFSAIPLDNMESRKNATGIGAKAIAIHPVLAKYTCLPSIKYPFLFSKSNTNWLDNKDAIS